MKKIANPIGPLLDKLTALTVQQKVVLFIVTFVLLGGGFYYFIYSDQIETIDRLNGSIAGQEKKLVEVKQAAAQVDVLVKEVAASEKEFGELLKFLPDQKEIPALLDNISQVGAQIGLENILFQPQGEVPKEFYAIIPIRLDMVGTYQQVGTFLDSLSKMNRILKVDSLNLNRAGGGPVLQVACSIVTYRFLETPPGGPPKK